MNGLLQLLNFQFYVRFLKKKRPKRLRDLSSLALPPSTYKTATHTVWIFVKISYLGLLLQLVFTLQIWFKSDKNYRRLT